ncbi:MAG: DnaD domain protein [Lachnospiraceae bacterium]|nr:DnaD domain protein [Lachnospiraceae bacterium]
MNTLTLVHDYSSAFTFVQNDFIDYYLKDINESQIKIYLYLLRSMGGNMQVSVSSIADFFNDSEKDVIRALKYLDKQKLIMLEYDNNKQPAKIRLLDAGENRDPEGAKIPAFDPLNDPEGSPVSVKRSKGKKETVPRKNYSAEELSGFAERSDIKELIYVAETYLKRTLSSNDLSTLLYFNEELGFSADLIEYLLEYCLSINKKSLGYMKSVAGTWSENGISSVEQAKQYVSEKIPGDVYKVFRAFGIKGREPADPETALVKKWLKTYDFSIDIIIEACSRTIMAIHEPSFDYAEKILDNWSKAGVRHLSDIEALDAARSYPGQGAKKSKPAKKTNGTGTDYDAIVNELIAMQK